MKKLYFVIMLCVAALFSANAQSAEKVSVKDLNYRFISKLPFTLEDALTSADPILADVRENRAAKGYALSVTAKTDICVQMTKITKFDTYMLLLDANYELMTYNYEAYSGSCIVARLDPGTYYIIATLYSSTDITSDLKYTFSVKETTAAKLMKELAYKPVTNFTDTLKDSITVAEPYLLDGRMGSRAKGYSVQLAAGDVFDAAVVESNDDMYMFLLDKDYNVIASNDDNFAPAGGDAHILYEATAAGTYTIVYDFKDTKGNTNKRTLSYKIEDGSGSVSPFIKQVTPVSGEQIKKSAVCNVTVSAAGGNTGTKLLFYKYTVRDASDKIVNVPYYTRSTSFSFTPSALGKYTVTVSVQGSDNSTVEREYVYDSVNTIVTPVEPEDPTEPAATPVTRPPATVATPLSDELQVTVLSVALSGVTVAVSVTVAPTVSCELPGETMMPVTATSWEGSMGLGYSLSSPGFVQPAITASATSKKCFAFIILRLCCKQRKQIERIQTIEKQHFKRIVCLFFMNCKIKCVNSGVNLGHPAFYK